MIVAAPILIVVALILVIGSWRHADAVSVRPQSPPVARATWSHRRRLKKNRADLRRALARR